jgi:hypothetical protein
LIGLTITLLVFGLICVSLALAAGSAADRETLTVGDTATGPTASKITKSSGFWSGHKATKALISVESKSVRCCMDGSTPTQGANGVGHELTAGMWWVVPGQQNVANLLCIAYTNGETAKIEATYFYGE